MKKKKKFDVVGFGPATIDYICLIGNIANYNQAVFISDIKFSSGGCVATALVTLQRLGGKSTFSSCLGDDWIGNEIVKRLKKEGIDCSAVEYSKFGLSPFSFIQVSQKTGDRAIAYFPGSKDLFYFNTEVKEAIKESEILLIDGLLPEEDLKAVRYAKKNNIKVMLDANIILDGTMELLPYIDFLITSKAFLNEYSKKEEINYSLKKVYKDLKPEILITTLGKEGSVSLINNEIVHVDTFRGNEIDTTGAGDVYHGAFLLGILKNWNVKDTMIFSSAVSSIKCAKYGGTEGIPDFKTTMDFLKKRGIDVSKFI